MAKDAVEDDDNDVLNVNVGVLGHVDSGKTSLVKTLSTLLSTAALDKSTQSRERGMTLDLGFSCFHVEMPSHLQHLGKSSKSKRLQITLVDCPGHASLIRTIIGGAQIIDMVLLVVDAFKGWQAQTTECLVLAELTSPHLVVALNKIDLLQEHNISLDDVKKDIRQRLRDTRFANAPLVGVSACVGGEKIAAAAATDVAAATSASAVNATVHMDQLVKVLREQLPPPKRNNTSGKFYFSIDHCFPIRGQGTVLTGTVLSGSIAVNSMLEFPTLGRLERKIKSIQMFRRKVQSISQGDRAGICVSNLDAKLLERGIAAAPGAVPLLKGAICLVRKVSYFQGTLVCGGKFHISVGHSTVMATVTFWGARELLAQQRRGRGQGVVATTKPDAANAPNSGGKKNKNSTLQSSLGGDADIAGLPRMAFNFDDDFIQQDRLLESLDGKDNNSNLLHWAMLEFQTPVFCPLDSLIIGSRLDAIADTSNTSTSNSGSCRLAFSGRLIQKAEPDEDAKRLRLYVPKEKRGVISRLGDPFRREDDQKIVRYDVFGTDLFKKETHMKPFCGMKVVTETTGDIGEIKSSFGTSGKFRVYFPGGTEAREGDVLILKFKRFCNDPKKEMHQDDYLTLPKARMGAQMQVTPKKKKRKESVVATGEIVTLKGEASASANGTIIAYEMAIVSGFFSQQDNIREKVGFKVRIPETKEEGVVDGPFGKAGKCKVSFAATGVSAPVGSKAELLS
jgi:selenocysteine-specific elongation factor